MSARDRILDAYTSLLIEEGDRATTLDAVSARAGLSKGGVLYHFPSIDALAGALFAALREQIDARREQLRTCLEGPAAAHLRGAVRFDSELGRQIVATTRLSNRSHPQAVLVLRYAYESWYELILEQVGDPATAALLLTLGDGLSYRAMIGQGKAFVATDDEAVSDPVVERAVELAHQLVAEGRETARVGADEVPADA